MDILKNVGLDPAITMHRPAMEPERRMVNQVDKLVKDGFIRDVKYPHLAGEHGAS